MAACFGSGAEKQSSSPLHGYGLLYVDLDVLCGAAVKPMLISL